MEVSIGKWSVFIYFLCLCFFIGCCNHSACCYCTYSHCYGSFVPYKGKISDSKQGIELQKNRHSTKDSLVQRDDSSNKKDARIQQCPECTHQMNNTSRDRIIHPQQDALQHTRNEDTHGDSSKTFIIGAQEVVGNKVKAAVERSLEDNLGQISGRKINITRKIK